MNTFKTLCEHEKIFLVTHDGVCHTDEVLATALLELVLEGKGVDYELVRTRDEEALKLIPEDSRIVYDVFNTPLDHHSRSTHNDGRPLSSIGLIWRWIKADIIDLYQIDPQEWRYIDKEVIAYVDTTDNTGKMNPLNCVMNAMRDTTGFASTSDNTFNLLVNMGRKIMVALLKRAEKSTYQRMRYKSLPIIKVGNLDVRFNDTGKHVQSFIKEDFECDGYLVEDGDVFRYMARRTADINSAIKDPRVNFIHKTGFVAEINDTSVIPDLYKFF